MPEELLELIIKTSSNAGDLVLDPFGGTDTTSAVAKKLNRNFITMETSKEYYNVILKRLDGNISDVKRNKKVETEIQNTLFDLPTITSLNNS